MPAADPQGSEKYWFNGLPFVGVRKTGFISGTEKYWFNGISDQFLYPTSGRATTAKSISIGQIKGLNLVRSNSRRVIVSQSKTVSLIRKLTASRVFAISKGSSVTLLYSVAKRIMINQVKSLALSRGGASTSRIISMTKTISLNLFRSETKRIIIPQIKALVFSTGGALTFNRIFQITQIKTASLFRTTQIRLLISQFKIVRMFRLLPRRILISQSKVVIIGRSYIRPWIILVSQSKSLLVNFLKTAAAPFRRTKSNRDPHIPKSRRDNKQHL